MNTDHRLTPRHLLTASLVCFAATLLTATQAHCQDRPLRRAASIALVSLAAVDGAQTTTCVRAGRCVEVNPIYRPVARSYVGIGLMKAAVASGILGASAALRPRHRVLSWTLLASATVAQGIVVGINARTLRRGR